MNLIVSRVGNTLLLGAHDVENCRESEGCVEVEIIEVWIHENYTIKLQRTPVNNIAMAKLEALCTLLYFCFVQTNSYQEILQELRIYTLTGFLVLDQMSCRPI